MPTIKWVGIIKNSLAEYQEGKLSEKSVKLDMPASIQIKAIPLLIPLLIILFVSMFIKVFAAEQSVINPFFFFIGIVCGFIGMLIHELLHAVVYPKAATVYIGIYPKAFAAVALASYPMKKSRFILMSLLPFILGIIPLIIFWFSPAEAKAINGFLFGIACVGMISPYPDVYNVYQAVKQAPPKSQLQFYGDDLYWIE